ncbi:glycosyltransferase family 4 protein [Paenibacillus motobuensis]|uniref:glycosyltransferase family 4 protein n=1 Tax=Paenibacillus TaxID=44249 RepID=UPI002041B9F0|nr:MULTISPECIES: glycosyltransferase family 4 protein [Paenibacillus]MCM3039617.1 glycosyltransferase family 4 protein [Paenibacillus lutimineralis]MCM3646721.1 glycosyltransferase family 4 protein [Paenibacillus motobuensis]
MGDESKLKIWVMTNEFEPKIVGGLGIVATQLTRMLSKLGAKVTVLCPGNSERLTISNANSNLCILRFPKNTKYFNRAQQSFKAEAIIKSASAKGGVKPDIIHVHSTEFANAAKVAGDRFNLPIVYTCHSLASQGISSLPGKLQTTLIRTANRIIVPSRWQAKVTRRLYPRIDGNKMFVIPHGVAPVTKGSTKAASHKLLYVGRLIPSKGVEPLIKAVGHLAQEKSKVHLTIVGSGKASYMNKLRTLAKQAGVAKRIRWAETTPHKSVQRMYGSYGAVINPSKKESFCLVALEAMANGVPLISTTSGGMKEFVTPQNAKIIHSVDSVHIARAIKEFWNNPEQSRKRTINARATAAQYKWPVIVRKYLSLFSDLKQGRP